MRFEFTGSLTARDFKRHIPHVFSVPTGCTRLHIYFHYAPARVDDIRNMLTLTLFDANGFRGAGHRHGDTHEITLTPATAPPGYRPGPLPAGEWAIQIDTHMILPRPDEDLDCTYTLTIEAETDIATAARDSEDITAVAPRFDFVANPAAGWYRGDLHAHTVHSDAAWDVAGLLAGARGVGLDFVTLTDHNTTTALAEFTSRAAPDLLTMGGMELTTFWGHAVCLGASEWIDWRVDMAGEAMNRIATEQYAAGNLFVIAHPQDQGDPFCTGCRWIYPQMRPGTARFVEVWNGRWASTDPREKNEGSLGLWYDWLNRGLRLTATAGSDAHGPAHYGDGVGYNVIYAQELSQAGILAGLRRGQSYLSAGPTIQFWAENSAGKRAEMGGALAADGEVTLHTGWADAPAGARLRLIRRGEGIEEQAADGQGEATWQLTPGRGAWYVVELRRGDGWMAGLTNPIFFE